MWKWFFTRAQIVGVDIEDKSFIDQSRITSYLGSQTDRALMERIVREHGAPTIVIDDGSHRSQDVVDSFAILFPMLADDGLYVIEDIQTSYWPRWGGSLDPDDPNTSMAMVRRLLDGLNHEEFLDPAYEPSYTDQHVVAVHCYHNLVLIQKGENAEGTNKRRVYRRVVRRERPRSSQSRNTTAAERCTTATRDDVRRNLRARVLPPSGWLARTTVSARRLPSHTHGGSMDGYYAWMLVATALVLMMTTPALALFYGGMTRSKSVLNMMMMSYIALAVVGIVFVLWGWSEGWGGDGVGNGNGKLIANPFTMFGLHGVTQQQLHLRALPAHLRGHHRRPDLRRHRRPREALVLDRLPADLGDALLLPDRPQRLGRRLVLLSTSRTWTTPVARSCTSTPVSPVACSP